MTHYLPLVPFTIGHFTVVYLVAKPLIWSEAEGDLVVTETYHNKVTLSLTPVQRLGNQVRNCEMDYSKRFALQS